MKDVKWAMIGCGQVTEVKSGPGLYKSENSKLIGVYNLDYERARDYTKRHGIEKTYKTVNELLEDSSIDIVYIATPPKFHKKLAIDCLNAAKIPYMEKPVAINYEDCIEIKELSEKLEIPVYVAFYRRGLEKFLKIKELLEQKVIGDVRYVYITQVMKVEDSELNRQKLPWRVIPDISGGGKFLDMGVHVLDCLTLFFGEMALMSGIVSNKGGYYAADDTVMATFEFKNGIVGSGTWCYVADQDYNKVEIVGNEGRIVYDGLAADSFTIIKDREEKYEFNVPEHIAMPYQQDIVNELLGKKKSYANFLEAINIVKMTDLLLKDYYNREV